MIYTDSKETIEVINWFRQFNPALDISVKNIGIKDLSLFIEKLKEADIWNKIMFWPLSIRQGLGPNPQNLVPGLGGLRQNIPTGVGSFTWGQEGGNFNGLNIRINRSNLQEITEFGIFACANFSNTTHPADSQAGYGVVAGDREPTLSNNEIGMSMVHQRLQNQVVFLAGLDGVKNYTVGGTAPTGNGVASLLFDGNITIPAINGIELTNVLRYEPLGTPGIPDSIPAITSLGTSKNFHIASRNEPYFGYTYRGTINFVAIFSGVVNTVEMYEIYKSTLGRRLNLP